MRSLLTLYCCRRSPRRRGATDASLNSLALPPVTPHDTTFPRQDIPRPNASKEAVHQQRRYMRATRPHQIMTSRGAGRQIRGTLTVIYRMPTPCIRPIHLWYGESLPACQLVGRHTRACQAYPCLSDATYLRPQCAMVWQCQLKRSFFCVDGCWFYSNEGRENRRRRQACSLPACRQA